MLHYLVKAKTLVLLLVTCFAPATALNTSAITEEDVRAKFLAALSSRAASAIKQQSDHIRGTSDASLLGYQRLQSRDCQNPTPSAPYTGFALKSGTGCASYVFCFEGSETYSISCPPGLLFDGGINQYGVCAPESQVVCNDETGAWSRELIGVRRKKKKNRDNTPGVAHAGANTENTITEINQKKTMEKVTKSFPNTKEMIPAPPGGLAPAAAPASWPPASSLLSHSENFDKAHATREFKKMFNFPHDEGSNRTLVNLIHSQDEIIDVTRSEAPNSKNATISEAACKTGEVDLLVEGNKIILSYLNTTIILKEGIAKRITKRAQTKFLRQLRKDGKKGQFKNVTSTLESLAGLIEVMQDDVGLAFMKDALYLEKDTVWGNDDFLIPFSANIATLFGWNDKITRANKLGESDDLDAELKAFIRQAKSVANECRWNIETN